MLEAAAGSLLCYKKIEPLGHIHKVLERVRGRSE
jgi:hypothetical protein